MDQPDEALFRENERTTPVADERKYFQAGDLQLASGGMLPSVTVAYETWGKLNADASNAVFVGHALSGDSHAVGWWDRIVGPGRAINTERFFVVCANVLGGCRGTTGPACLAQDGAPYGSRWPQVTIEDMTRLHVRLLHHLGISELAAGAGGSMGGMQVLELALQFPMRKAWVTASAAKHTAMQIGFNEVGRQAIYRDPAFVGGDYAPGQGPAHGLAVARMLGHLTFLSQASFERKFGRSKRASESGEQFEVASYLNYQGDKFVQRFDANSLLSLTTALDAYEFVPTEPLRTEFLLTSFASDWIYPSFLSEELAQTLAPYAQVTHVVLPSPLGHDAFLLDDGEQAEAVRNFLQ